MRPFSPQRSGGGRGQGRDIPLGKVSIDAHGQDAPRCHDVGRPSLPVRGGRLNHRYEQQIEFALPCASALPPKADMCSATRDVRFGPEADIGSPLSDNRFTGPKTWLGMREKKEFSSSVGARISSLQKGQISVARLSEYRLV